MLENTSQRVLNFKFATQPQFTSAAYSDQIPITFSNDNPENLALSKLTVRTVTTRFHRLHICTPANPDKGNWETQEKIERFY